MGIEFRIGVEEEYQLVDQSTGALRSRARDVIGADWSDEIRAEMQETTVEIGTCICDSASDAREEIARLRFQVAAAAATESMAIVAAGTHPFSSWEAQRGTEEDRYEQIRERYARIARDEHIFGMHIHIEVPDRVDRVRVLDRVRPYLPHLLALSASSPFYEGDDSGFASYRNILWRRWPLSGVPPRFGSTLAFRAAIDTLLQAGVLQDEKSIYWSARPHPVYPTLELRVTDACPSIDDAVAIAAFARVLVAAAAEGVLPDRPWPELNDSAEHAVLDASEWCAARYGLDSALPDPSAEQGRVPLRSSLRRLLDLILPVAEAMGEEEELALLEPLLDRGSAADRMREIARDRGRGGRLVSWMEAETMLGTGIDRRGAQRVREELSA